MTGQYASAHTENPKSKYYTKSGALEGSRSDLLLGATGTPLGDIDGWLTAPFHAIGMLRSGLTKVAFASGFAGAGLDVLGGLNLAAETKPIMFPGRNVTTNLTWYSGNELPNPLESCHYPKAAKAKPVGLPIIVLLPKTPVKVADRDACVTRTAAPKVRLDAPSAWSTSSPTTRPTRCTARLGWRS